MEASAENIEGDWWVTLNGEKFQVCGPGIIGCVRAILYAGRLNADIRGK